MYIAFIYKSLYKKSVIVISDYKHIYLKKSFDNDVREEVYLYSNAITSALSWPYHNNMEQVMC